jgi:hypothetical protein|eukprot:COSAG01_NODE_7833_length_3035_cov_1.938351_8_plen_82_part_00
MPILLLSRSIYNTPTPRTRTGHLSADELRRAEEGAEMEREQEATLLMKMWLVSRLKRRLDESPWFSVYPRMPAGLSPTAPQ